MNDYKLGTVIINGSGKIKWEASKNKVVKAVESNDGIHSNLYVWEGTYNPESFKFDDSIVGGTKFHDYKGIAKNEIEMLEKTAQNGAEKYAAKSLRMFNNMTDHPWVSWSGKGLQAGDDFFKSLVARMDLRYQAALEADEFAGFIMHKLDAPIDEVIKAISSVSFDGDDTLDSPP